MYLDDTSHPIFNMNGSSYGHNDCVGIRVIGAVSLSHMRFVGEDFDFFHSFYRETHYLGCWRHDSQSHIGMVLGRQYTGLW